jgi:predicted acylesterase/phospholipase RssA
MFLLQPAQPKPSAAEPTESLVLALSGGGLRATLFHLGIFVYLAQTNRLKDVRGIVSVSGGSILAAHFRKEWQTAKNSPEGFVGVATSLVKFARGDLRNSVLIPWLWSRLLPCWWVRRLGRTARLEQAYRNHYGEMTIADLANSSGPEMALVATDAKRQQRVAFTFDRVRRFLIIKSSEAPNPDDILTKGTKLSLAVAASSCFPPIFPRMHLEHTDLGIRYDEFQDVLSVSDGGVTDNLGIEVLLGMQSRGSCNADMTLVCDAERPLVFRPRGGIRDDIEIQSVALSQAAKQHIESTLQGKCRFISLADRTSGASGLSYGAETHLAGFRTDLDSPSWQEVHALILHGAAVAAKKIDGGITTHETQDRIRGTISQILVQAGAPAGPAGLAKPQARDLERCRKRPIGRILLHVLLVLCFLTAELFILGTGSWFLAQRLFSDSGTQTNGGRPELAGQSNRTSPEPDDTPPASYQVRIIAVGNVVKVREGQDLVKADIFLNKSVPNDLWLLKIVEDGHQVSLPLFPVVRTGDDEIIEGLPTDRLTGQWSPLRLGISKLDLRDKKARLDRYPRYEVRITEVQIAPGGPQHTSRLALKFDRPVPNGNAFMTIKPPGAPKTRVVLWPLTAVNEGEPTVVLIAAWSRDEAFAPENLRGLEALIVSIDYPPGVPGALPVLPRIYNELDLIRLNQLKKPQ